MAYEVLAFIRDFELYRISPIRPEIETVSADEALRIVGLDGIGPRGRDADV